MQRGLKANAGKGERAIELVVAFNTFENDIKLEMARRNNAAECQKAIEWPVYAAVSGFETIRNINVALF